MALAVDATGSVNTGAIAAASPSWSHTTASSAGAFMVIGVSWSGANTITSVTYAGGALTLASGTRVTNGTNNTAIYAGFTSAVGAQTAQVNFSSTTNCIAVSLSFTGAGGVEAGTSVSASANSAALPVMMIGSGDYTFDIISGPSFVFTQGGSQTSVFADTSNSGGAFHSMSSRSTSAQSSGTFSEAYSISNTTAYTMSAIAIRDASNRPSVRANSLRPHPFSPGLAR